MAICKPGSEPENIKKRLNILFPKLDGAYPDKVIIGLYNEHKKWAETVTELYRLLGYSDAKSFLESYGYTYLKKSPSGGRPSTINPEEIIKELQSRYPDGSNYTSVDELFAANPDLEPKKKTVANRSSEVFGVGLKTYLLSIGLIKEKEKLVVAEKQKKKQKYKVAVIKLPLIDEPYYFFAQSGVYKGDYVEVSFNTYSKHIIGEIINIDSFEEDNLPCNISNINTIIRKVGTREYKNNLFENTLSAKLLLETNLIFKKMNIIPFEYKKTILEKTTDELLWGYCRGISSEIMCLLEYLIKNDQQTYDYQDIILISPGICELRVYCDDIVEISKIFPNIKIAAFAKNLKTEKYELYYSHCGYAGFTETYEISDCNYDWVLKHSPTQDCFENRIDYKFKLAEDWEAINYTFKGSENVMMKIEGSERNGQ